MTPTLPKEGSQKRRIYDALIAANGDWVNRKLPINQNHYEHRRTLQQQFNGEVLGCRGWNNGHTTGDFCGNIEAKTEDGRKIICTLSWSKPLSR
jgi:hypothetical protein